MLSFKQFTEQSNEPDITLYRGSGSGKETGSFWTSNLDLAEKHAAQRPDGAVHKITLPYNKVPTYFKREDRGAGRVHVLKRGNEKWADENTVIHS
tara:strand:- start:1829 stop:2113 length:285 start_codon:yes stop_codon:yes gene_type:complete